jgi:autotransporter-associated beta strand protein
MGSLTLQSDALTAPRIAVAAGSHTVSVPLVLTGATTITVDGLTSLLSLTGGITGGQAVTKTGSGTLALGGVNTLGALAVSAGKVRFAAGSTTVSALMIAAGATCDFATGTLYIQKDGGGIDTMEEVNAAITANTITLRGKNVASTDFKVTEETINSVVYVKVMLKSTGTLIKVL